MDTKKVEEALGIGKRLKEVRGNASIETFANLLGLHKNTLFRYEKEESYPDARVLHNLLKNFGVDPFWLLTGEEKKLNDQLVNEVIEIIRKCEDESNMTLDPEDEAQLFKYLYNNSLVGESGRGAFELMKGKLRHAG